ncbi:hypothetical protein LNKW23_19320 [Paralimibaculum aggregatum]|uniref:Type I phosphodiesterase/nucleotide pyrophosphatase n=1 Tax=Paralimibaculum aggregatum TaxID=3036245 RepID=A0ABQ6LKG1_9RHOB|nr:hypothetical protein [Limibaculum sp. NKW23]GMG82719.1 hypothetical protein LNKW23_19320 [Limibaculum sp. NKW23]
MQGRRIVLYELNEVPWRILDHFARRDPQSPLGRLAARARRYETTAEDSGHLSPWVTWPTLHRGVTNLDHEISHFGQDLGAVNREFPPLWELAARAGIRTGVFGSLHSYPPPASLDGYAFHVPDTFAAGPECFPKSLETFQRFNLAMVDQAGRDVGRGIALGEAARFLARAPGLGLRGRTVAKLAGQVLAERVNPQRAVRRRTSQMQIAFDFFAHALERERPQLAMFFTNHVASSMHRYWPALFPEDYESLAYDADWLQTWGGEIPFTIAEANHQLGRLMRFVEANPDHALIVASSMGQAAVEGREKDERELTLKSHARLAAALGLAPGEWSKERAMAPQFVFRLVPGAVERFVQGASTLTVNGRPQKVTRLDGDRVCIDIGVVNLEDDAIAVTLKGEAVDHRAIGLVNLSLQDAAGANAYHIPEGILLVYEPGAGPAGAGDGTTRALSTTEVAPAILANFGLARPGYMAAAGAL